MRRMEVDDFEVEPSSEEPGFPASNLADGVKAGWKASAQAFVDKALGLI